MKRPVSAAVVLTVALVAVTAAASTSALAQVPAGQDALAGSRVFGLKGCVTCHAVKGAGGKIGPDLGRLERPHSFYDLASAMWNHLPRMAARMQALKIVRPRLDADDAANLIAFLYTLNYFEPAGDVAAGRTLFTRKRCVVCHQVEGVGGVVGPNLDFLRQVGSPIFVATAMWNHGPQMIELMRARGVVRPSFTGAELRDLLAYLMAGPGPRGGPLYVLPGRPDSGRLLFAQKRCVECHGPASGARVAPELARRGVSETPLEFAALMWNKAPAMLAAMRKRSITVPTLRAEEMADIVAYLQSAGYFARPGSVQRGWKVSQDKGCFVCHGVYGERGKPAGDLAKARGLESPAGVLAALWNHTLVTAPAPGGDRRPWPELRPDQMADLVALLQSLGRPR